MDRWDHPGVDILQRSGTRNNGRYNSAKKGQAIVCAAEANVILSLEPVFTAILGLLLLGESTTWHEKIGGGLIVLASIISTSIE